MFEWPGHCRMGSGRNCKSQPKMTIALHACIITTLFNVFLCEQDFYYPENVAYPIGGPGDPGLVLLQMHYDNPQQVSGMILCDVTA